MFRKKILKKFHFFQTHHFLIDFLRPNPSRGNLFFMTPSLTIGDLAPDFSTIAVGGEYGEGAPFTLSTLKGRRVVLYFYPKDDTPGCTSQACSLRENYRLFTDAGVFVFGISADSLLSHCKFQQKHDLPFPLLSDESRNIIQSYGVWVEKSMYGKKYMGIERSSFIINENGAIQAIYRKVKPAEHTRILLSGLAIS